MTPASQPQGISDRTKWMILAAIVGLLVWNHSQRLEPIPFPNPGPNPAPQPEPKKVAPAWVIIVEESSQRTPETAKLLAATAFWKGLETQRIKWRVYDIDSKEAETYRPHANEVGIPALLFLGPNGQVLLKQKLPASLQELKGLLP